MMPKTNLSLEKERRPLEGIIVFDFMGAYGMDAQCEAAFFKARWREDSSASTRQSERLRVRTLQY